MIIVNSTNVGDSSKKKRRENCFVKMIVGLGESPVSLGTGSADFVFQAGGPESVSAGSVHLPGTRAGAQQRWVACALVAALSVLPWNSFSLQV